MAEELEEASNLLRQYQKALEEDLANRSSFIALLTEYIEIQENAISKHSQDLQVYLSLELQFTQAGV